MSFHTGYGCCLCIKNANCYNKLGQSLLNGSFVFHIQAGSGSAVGKGVFQRYKLARRDGLHWSYARCLQIPDEAGLTRWEKQRTAQLERMKARAEKQAAE